MKSQNNAKPPIMVTAKKRTVRAPIGWHFNGREIPLTFYDDEVSLADIFTGFDTLPVTPREHPLNIYWRSEVRRWKVAFWMAFVGFIIVSAISLMK